MAMKTLFENKTWSIMEGTMGSLILINNRKYMESPNQGIYTLKSLDEVVNSKFPKYIQVELESLFAQTEEVVQSEEAPAVKEFTIYRKNDVHIVSAPQGEYALTIGGKFNVDYKDEHGEYHIENLLFMGSGPANDCLLFKNDREDILHMDPLKVQRVTIPFPFKTEREKQAHETVFGVFNDVKKQNKVDLFKRYHELLQKALIPNNITDEEREEMIILYEEVKDNISELAYAAFSGKTDETRFDELVKKSIESGLTEAESEEYNVLYSKLGVHKGKKVKGGAQ